MTADLNDLNLKIEKIEKVSQNLSMEQSELSKSVSSKFSNIEQSTKSNSDNIDKVFGILANLKSELGLYLKIGDDSKYALQTQLDSHILAQQVQSSTFLKQSELEEILKGQMTDSQNFVKKEELCNLLTKSDVQNLYLSTENFNAFKSELQQTVHNLDQLISSGTNLQIYAKLEDVDLCVKKTDIDLKCLLSESQVQHLIEQSIIDIKKEIDLSVQTTTNQTKHDIELFQKNYTSQFDELINKNEKSEEKIQ